MRDKARNFKDWYKVADSGCWLWQGAVNSSGYANKYYKGRMETAHRLSWLLHKGEIPAGQLVLHKCDVRRCVNPDHLFLGSQQENLKDAASKGRTTSKFSVEEVKQMFVQRASGMTLQAIGNSYGVRKQTISEILKRNTHEF